MLYIHGILLASSDIGLLLETRKFLSEILEIKDLGKSYFMIGIQIHHDRSHSIDGLTHKAYVESMLVGLAYGICKERNTIFAHSSKVEPS